MVITLGLCYFEAASGEVAPTGMVGLGLVDKVALPALTCADFLARGIVYYEARVLSSPRSTIHPNMRLFYYPPSLSLLLFVGASELTKWRSAVALVAPATKQLRSFDSSSTALDLDAYTFIGNGTCKSSAYEEYDRITTRVASGAGAAEQCATFCGTIAYTTHVGIELHPGGDGEDTACNCLYEDDTTPVKKPNRDASFHGRGEIRWVGGNVASKCFKFEKHVEGMQLVGVGFPVDCQANDFITTSKLTTTTTPSSAKDCIEACKTSHYVYSQSQRDLGSLDESDNAGFAFLRGENGAPNECKCFVREENQCNMIMGDNDKSVGDLYCHDCFSFQGESRSRQRSLHNINCSPTNIPTESPTITQAPSDAPTEGPTESPTKSPTERYVCSMIFALFASRIEIDIVFPALEHHYSHNNRGCILQPSMLPSDSPSSTPSDAPSVSLQPSISAQVWPLS
eukprot:scaffold103_cov193-Alexandrium_tamarense.AAC.32